MCIRDRFLCMHANHISRFATVASGSSLPVWCNRLSSSLMHVISAHVCSHMLQTWALWPYATILSCTDWCVETTCYDLHWELLPRGPVSSMSKLSAFFVILTTVRPLASRYALQYSHFSSDISLLGHFTIIISNSLYQPAVTRISLAMSGPYVAW